MVVSRRAQRTHPRAVGAITQVTGWKVDRDSPKGTLKNFKGTFYDGSATSRCVERIDHYCCTPAEENGENRSAKISVVVILQEI